MVRGRFDPDPGYLHHEGGVGTMRYYDYLCHLPLMLGLSMGHPEKFYRLENFLSVHIVPLMFFFDTLVIDKSKQYRKPDPFLWT